MPILIISDIKLTVVVSRTLFLLSVVVIQRRVDSEWLVAWMVCENEQVSYVSRMLPVVKPSLRHGIAREGNQDAIEDMF